MTRSDHAKIIEQAFTAQAASFGASAIANSSDILDAIVEHADPKGSQRWLEAACGPGIISRRLAPHVGSVHGVDVTEAMVEAARAQASESGLDNATFDSADATATGLPTASFDGAVTRFSVHHIPLPVRLLEEMARLVRPGGRVIVVDHLADEAAAERSWSQEIERLRDPSHWASLSATELRELGERAGLTFAAQSRWHFQLGFEDWLRRGTDDEAARELVRRSVADRPAGTSAFGVIDSPTGRVLQLTVWLGLWLR